MNFSTHIIPATPLAEGYEKHKLVVEQHDFPTQSSHTHISFLMSHAIGFHKEIFRPLVKRIADQLRSLKDYDNTDFSFFLWDARHHGDSALLNEISSDRYRWVTHALDTKQVIDVMKLKEKGQVVGIGHSVGASCMILAESLFPNTFDALCLIEVAVQPKIDLFSIRRSDPVYASIKRRDEWPNREACLKSLSKNPFYASFHPEILKSYANSAVYDTEKETVKLKCSKEHELHLYLCASLDSGLTFIAAKTIKIPVHYVFGNSSYMVTKEGSKSLLQANPLNTVEWINGSHMIICELPDITTSHVIKLVKRVSGENKDNSIKPRL